MTETQTSAAVTPRLKTRYREEILPRCSPSSTSRTSCRCPA